MLSRIGPGPCDVSLLLAGKLQKRLNLTSLGTMAEGPLPLFAVAVRTNSLESNALCSKGKTSKPKSGGFGASKALA